jgi:hypothetical protein
VASRERQYESLGAALDQLLAETVFERMKPPCDRDVIHAQGPGRRRQASMPAQGEKNSQILPVDLCAFFISHGSR